MFDSGNISISQGTGNDSNEILFNAGNGRVGNIYQEGSLSTDPIVINSNGAISFRTDENDRITIADTGAVGITNDLQVDGEIQQGSVDYGAFEIQTSGQIYANDYIVANGGMRVGTSVDPGQGVLSVQRYITQFEQSADPADPAEGSYTLWMSDGTGSGDDGDIMMKITAGGTTKTVTIVDFSAA